MQALNRRFTQRVSRSRGGFGALALGFVLMVATGAANAQFFFNQSPKVTLTAGTNTVTTGSSTTLTANATDPDGTVSKVLFYDGGNLLGQVNAPSPFVWTFSSTTNGLHSVYAVAYDNKNAKGTSPVLSINVAPPGNAPPTVSLTAAPASFTQGGKTTLTATAADPDGTISKVIFYNGAAVLGQRNAPPYTYEFKSFSTGVYAIEAEAYDNFNVSTRSAPVQVTVTPMAGFGGGGGGGGPTPNAPPTVSLSASPTALTLGAATTLTAQASDSDGTITKVEFYNGANLLTSDASSPYSYAFTPGSNGTYMLTAKAYDNLNAVTTSSTVSVTVTSPVASAGNPVVTLTVNGGNLLVVPGTTVTLNATAAAVTTGATVSRVSFFVNGVNVGDDLASPYSVTATLPSAGSYAIYAQVTDSLNQIGTSQTQVATAGSAAAVATTDANVWRLLNQATFGASQAEAARVVSLGVTGWINDQLAKPISGYPDSKYNRIQLSSSADCTTQMPNGMNYPGASPQAMCSRDHLTLAMVQRDFFTNAIGASDQLRQRVAWALSQILVTSAAEPDLSFAHVMSRYQNILFEEAFGNFETLLQRITYNAAMGNYLDMVNNDRPAGTKVPNENYAREIMQLFSIGLVELNADGTPILDQSNNPVPSYGQAEIAEFARVFTGYTYATAADPTGTAPGKRNTRYYGAPMVPYISTASTGHDPNVKTLLNGTTLPANQTAKQDIDAAVRNVFLHENTGPFISKQLIQRLVTGNPSKKYVEDVSAKFADNGAGVRGDMAAVVKAILNHTEARGSAKKTAPDFGQLREPVLIITSMIRALGGITDGASLEGAASALGQRPYYAPTVFNYFMPDNTIPGSGVLGPEFQIHTTNSAIGRANLVYRLVYQGYNPDTTIANASGTRLFIAQFEPIAHDAAALVAQVNKVLAGGQFPVGLEPTIVAAVNAINLSATPTAQQRTDRARMAVYLMASSYDYQVQR